MASVFKVPVALVTILGQSDCFFKSNVGALAGVTHRPRENTFCDAIMVPDVPEVLVVEDAVQDARFSRNDGVISDPHMRFYAGAPLIGADGFRYGTLCVVDFRPRSFPAGLYNTLMNFAELVVREMERDRVLELRAQSYEAAHALLRSPAAYSQAVALVDVSCGRWDILYANPLWAAAVGVPAEECPQDTLWDQYCVADSVQSALMEAALAEGRPVDIRVLKLSGDGDDIDDLRVRTLTLRPAAVDALEASVPVGVPSFVAPGGMQRCSASTSDSGSGSVNSGSMAKCLWFAVLQQQVAEQKRAVEEASVSAEWEAFNNAVGGLQEEEAEQAQPDVHEAFLVSREVVELLWSA